MSIKAKQVAGVTTLVIAVVAVLSALHLATLARLSLQETESRGEMLANAIFQAAREVPGPDVTEALRTDRGVRSILESSIGYSPNVTYAAIVDPDGKAVVHSFQSQEGTTMTPQEELEPLVQSGPMAQLQAVYSDRTFEVRQPVLFGQREGSIRIGVSTILVRTELGEAMRRALQTAFLALLVATLVALVLSQWMLRPIHVIQSGLSRLGRGELDVRLDLPGQEFRDLGSSFDAISAQLAAVGHARTEANPEFHQGTDLESVMENLEDAVALFSPSGEVIFRNSAMRALRIETLPRDHEARQLVDRTLAGRKSQGPLSVSFRRPDSRDDRPPDQEARSASDADPQDAERLILCHAIEDQHGRFVGAMLVARNIAYMTQVQSTLNYSRKLAAFGRLMAGVAHEVKNPLNAMTIHLELLKQKLAAVREPVTVPVGAGASRSVDLSKHVNIIGDEIRRLDQVVAGFLKFARPEELKLQPVRLTALVSEVTTTVKPEAESRGIVIRTECPDTLPEINADPGMLSQALLNLAINACHAMPEGGTLRLVCRAAAHRRVEIDVEDSGVGIPPEHLGRIFDLYFTTKEKGSGIGLSMVYRIVQLHDGEVEVQSTPGRGTRFRLILPQA
jgi:signal transduction histidine kinase